MIKTINRHILEYVENEKNIDIYSVFQYLKPTKEKKEIDIRNQWDDLVNRFSTLIPYFVELNNINMNVDEYNPEINVETIYSMGLDDKFEMWLIDNFESFYFEDFDIPSWYYFKNPKIVKGTFIHFSNNVDDILKNGFTFGVDDITIMGMTTLLGGNYKKRGGLNFAYLLSDVENIKRGRYGNDYVVFDGIGIRTYHIITKEYEVIFNPKDISNIRKNK